ncbi:MAG: OmpP1/FadL family transporter [Janthinobacterium lividum]
MKRVTISLATLLSGFLGLSQYAQAQGTYVDDALLFSRTGPSGTARSLGVGGAATALGGDFSSLSINPAGLGLFTKSEFTFSPGIGIGNSTSRVQLNGASTGSSPLDQSANSFHIASVGLVFASRRADNDQSSDWRGGAFSLGFTRQADFNQAFRYQNQTDDGHSFFQFLREPGGYSSPASTGYQSALSGIRKQESTGNYVDLDGLAYGAYLTGINPVTTTNPYAQINRVARTDANNNLVPVQQNEVLKTKGSLSQFDLGYGGNYRDRLYLGGAVGIVSLNRTRTSTFGETTEGEEDFHYDDYLKTTGTGINARVGLIFRAADALRLGASIQTPTYISLHDEYSTTLVVNPGYVPSGADNVLTTQPGLLDYSIVTPFRANGGIAALVSKYGFFTADVEYVGYSQARFGLNNDDGTLAKANGLAKSFYKNTINVRTGLEVRLDAFRLRAGAAVYGNPYSQGTANRRTDYVTGGLGYRGKTFFIDAAAVYSGRVFGTLFGILDDNLETNKFTDQYKPYTLATATTASPAIDIDAHRTTATITAGFLF